MTKLSDYLYTTDLLIGSPVEGLAGTGNDATNNTYVVPGLVYSANQYTDLKEYLGNVYSTVFIQNTNTRINQFKTVDYLNNTWFAAGDNSTILYSTDACVWSFYSVGFSTDSATPIRALEYANNTYIALNASGLGTVQIHRLALSQDGISWYYVRQPATSSNVVGGGGGLYVVTPAASSNGQFFTTTDFSTYTSFAPVGAENTTYYSYVYANNKHILGGQNATTGILVVSSDGTNWSIKNPNVSSARYMAYGNNAIAVASTNEVSVSLDENLWIRNPSILFRPSTSRGLAYGNGLFVCAGGAGNVTVYDTGDAFGGWSTYRIDSSVTRTVNGLVFDGQNFLASSHIANVMYISSNGQFTLTQNIASNASSSLITKFAVGPSNTVIYRGDFESQGIKFANSNTFYSVPYPMREQAIVTDLVYNNNNYFIVANTQCFVFSAFSGVYTANNLGGSSLLAPFKSNVLMIGTTNYRTTDGVIVSGTIGLPFSTPSMAVSSGDITVIGGPTGSDLWYTTNGINWNSAGSAPLGRYNTGVYAQGKFTIGGFGSTVASSTDGITWISSSSISPVSNVVSIAYNDGLYSLVSNTNIVLYSLDAVNWSNVNTGIISPTLRLEPAIAVGPNNSILMVANASTGVTSNLIFSYAPNVYQGMTSTRYNTAYEVYVPNVSSTAYTGLSTPTNTNNNFSRITYVRAK